MKTRLVLFFGLLLLTFTAAAAPAFAADTCGGGPGRKPIQTSINIGCEGRGNALTDALFAIIRFLSAGVGIVIIASVIFAGIKFTASHGDPNATAEAVNRIKSNVVALGVFIFGYAILNFVIPGGFFAN